MNEVTVRIKGNGDIAVETKVDGINSYKRIEPDELIKCIGSGILRGGISSGLLPPGCLSYCENDDGEKTIALVFPEKKADISYYGTLYPNFPLPKLVFSFTVSREGRVSGCCIGITSNTALLRPDTEMYLYPFSNVSGFKLCTGNNVLPKCKSLHTLGSLPYFILNMPNNDDHFQSNNNKLGLQMRDLLETLKDKPPEYYYTDILVPFKGVTLNDFISKSSKLN